MTAPIDHWPKPESWKWTRAEAWDRWACARCGRPVAPLDPDSPSHIRNWAATDRDEYWISGICPDCWRAIFDVAD